MPLLIAKAGRNFSGQSNTTPLPTQRIAPIHVLQNLQTGWRITDGFKTVQAIQRFEMPSKIVHHIMEKGLVASIREDHRIRVQRSWKFGNRNGFTNWLRPNDMATVGSLFDQYVAWCKSHPIPSDEPASQAKEESVAATVS